MALLRIPMEKVVEFLNIFAINGTEFVVKEIKIFKNIEVFDGHYSPLSSIKVITSNKNLKGLEAARDNHRNLIYEKIIDGDNNEPIIIFNKNKIDKNEVIIFEINMDGYIHGQDLLAALKFGTPLFSNYLKFNPEDLNKFLTSESNAQWHLAFNAKKEKFENNLSYGIRYETAKLAAELI